jgi:hypothetical protein
LLAQHLIIGSRYLILDYTCFLPLFVYVDADANADVDIDAAVDVDVDVDDSTK